MIRQLLAIALLLMTGVSVAAPPDKRPIERSISALVEQFSDGSAANYPEFRYVRFGHIFDSKSEDAVAFFSIEGFGGTNYHAEYIALFASVPQDSVAGRKIRPYRLVAVAQIGGRGWRTFDWESAVLKPESVTVSGKRWLADDPGCCASGPIVATFRVENGSIEETK